VQWYLNVPALRNTRLKVSPGASEPESHTPLIDVEVWVVFPAFVHRTFVPFAMVIVVGLKAKLTIFTRLIEVGADGVVVLGRAPRPMATPGTCNEPTSTTATNPVPTRIEIFPIPHIPSSTGPSVQYEPGAGSDAVWPRCLEWLEVS
jgi:hypothetical protein